MSRDLQLLGRAKRTHDGYLREVRKLACYFGLSPDQLTQQQVADYLLHLINDRKFAPGSLKVTYRSNAAPISIIVIQQLANSQYPSDF